MKNTVAQCIHSGKPIAPKTISPIFNLTVVAALPRQFPKLAEQDALSGLGGAVTIAIRLKAIIRVNEHEIGARELLDGPGKQFQACCPTLGDGAAA